MDIKDVQRLKRDVEERITQVISKELRDFHNQTGLICRGVDTQISVHRAFGKGDEFVVLGVKIEAEL